MDERRRSGTVKIFRSPGWGFLSQDKGGDLFFRRGDFDKSITPEPGQRVSYLIAKGPRGLRAVKVRVLDTSEATTANWWEFIDALPFPLRKLQEDRAQSREEMISAALKGSTGLRN